MGIPNTPKISVIYNEPFIPLDYWIHNLSFHLAFFLIDHSYSPLDYFVQCCFPWVKRESNSAAHVTAKLSFASSESFCLNKDNLPRVVHSACLGDCLPALCVWIKIEVYPKKKKKSIENELELVGNFKLMFKYMPKFGLQ